MNSPVAARPGAFEALTTAHPVAILRAVDVEVGRFRLGLDPAHLLAASAAGEAGVADQPAADRAAGRNQSWRRWR